MNKFDLSTLSNDAADQYTWSAISQHPSQLSASQYLEYSENDLLDGRTTRHIINALSNAKKSLHIRLEEICLGFGIGIGSIKKKRFPQLIDYVRECGIVAPRILDRLNTLRNAVEHDYIIPSEADVETFVDVVTLFLAATERWMVRHPVEIDYYHPNNNSILNTAILSKISLIWDIGEVRLIFKDPKGSYYGPAIEEITYKSPSPEFFHCVKFALKNSS